MQQVGKPALRGPDVLLRNRSPSVGGSVRIRPVKTRHDHTPRRLDATCFADILARMQSVKGVDPRFAWLIIILACLLVVFAFYFTLSGISPAPRTVTVTISNVEPRRDVTGQIINAHRGCLQFFNGTFYLYGTAFGTNEDDFAKGMTFVVYSSPDLKNWTYVGKLLKDPPAGFYSRAFVVFNPKTRKYVAWYSWFPKLWDGQAGVAVSDTPTGPFVVVNPKANLIAKDPGDGSLFVDDDGTGYYIYTAMDKVYELKVEQLTPDFLDTDGKLNNTGIANGVEAPVLFRRGNIYYILSGPLCPDCPEGSELLVLASGSPLGPFTGMPPWNINKRNAENKSTNRPDTSAPGKASTDHTYSVKRGDMHPNIPVQQTWVLKLPADQGANYIWIADRWGSAPDGVSAHDLQYWSPLHFLDNGQIVPLKEVPEWKISFATQE